MKFTSTHLRFLLVVGFPLAILGGTLFLHFGTSAVLSQTSPVMPDLTQMTDFERGQYYFNQDGDPTRTYDPVKARENYQNAILASSTANPLVWYQLGRVDFIEGKFDAALDKFNKHIEHFGDSVPNVYYMIGLTYGYKAMRSNDPADWEKGEDGFKKFIEYDPTIPWTKVDLAWLYFEQGKYEDMLEPLESGLKDNPDHPWLLNMYGTALLNLDRHEEAVPVLEKAKQEAAKLTVEDWGKAYSGNDPATWPEGLRIFEWGYCV